MMIQKKVRGEIAEEIVLSERWSQVEGVLGYEHKLFNHNKTGGGRCINIRYSKLDRWGLLLIASCAFFFWVSIIELKYQGPDQQAFGCIFVTLCTYFWY